MKSKFVGTFALLTFSLTLFTAGVLGISSAQAATITVGPASYSIQYSGVPGAVDVTNSASPQSSTYRFQGGSLDVFADAAATTGPATSAGVASGGCTPGGCAGGGYSVTATVRY